MARLILACLVAVAGYAAWRAVRRRLGARPGAARVAAPTSLRRDPATGVYRPLKDGD